MLSWIKASDNARKWKIPGEPGQLRVKDDQECCGRPDTTQKGFNKTGKERKENVYIRHIVCSFGLQKRDTNSDKREELVHLMQRGICVYNMSKSIHGSNKPRSGNCSRAGTAKKTTSTLLCRGDLTCSQTVSRAWHVFPNEQASIVTKNGGKSVSEHRRTSAIQIKAIQTHLYSLMMFV